MSTPSSYADLVRASASQLEALLNEADSFTTDGFTTQDKESEFLKRAEHTLTYLGEHPLLDEVRRARDLPPLKPGFVRMADLGGPGDIAELQRGQERWASILRRVAPLRACVEALRALAERTSSNPVTPQSRSEDQDAVLSAIGSCSGWRSGVQVPLQSILEVSQRDSVQALEATRALSLKKLVVWHRGGKYALTIDGLNAADSIPAKASPGGTTVSGVTAQNVTIVGGQANSVNIQQRSGAEADELASLLANFRSVLAELPPTQTRDEVLEHTKDLEEAITVPGQKGRIVKRLAGGITVLMVGLGHVTKAFEAWEKVRPYVMSWAERLKS